MNPDQAYVELVRLSRGETVLTSCLELLEWDEEVCMPRGGGEHRAEQMALLAGLVHDRGTDPRYDELLSSVEASPLVSDPESPQAVNVRELRRGFDRECRMPRRLVEESARVAALASQTWAHARKQDDFKTFAPWLDRIFALAREEADAVGYVGARYDALLDEYEPGMTTDRLSALFTHLEAQLVPLVASLRDEPTPAPGHVLAREFPLDRQRLFVEGVAGALGFDLQCGRLDVGHHPFCTSIGPGDVRIALRYYPRNFARGFFALLHEIGHALYDQGLDPAQYGTPMGEAASLGLHESQSRLWENLVGRSHGFWQHFYPQLRSAFPSWSAPCSRATSVALISPALGPNCTSGTSASLRRTIEPAASRTDTGRKGSSGISQLTRWATSTRPNSSPPPSEQWARWRKRLRTAIFARSAAGWANMFTGMGSVTRLPQSSSARPVALPTRPH